MKGVKIGEEGLEEEVCFVCTNGSLSPSDGGGEGVQDGVEGEDEGTVDRYVGSLGTGACRVPHFGRVEGVEGNGVSWN